MSFIWQIIVNALASFGLKFTMERIFLSCAGGSALLPSMQNAERYVARWREAGLIDESTATAIRTYEQAQAKAEI